MLLKETISKMKELKLHAFTSSFESQLAQPSYSELSFEDRVGICIDAEVSSRASKKFSSQLKLAKLKEPLACIENIDYNPTRKINRGFISTMASCNWIDHGQNLIITGPSGAGKTWVACAFGNNCIRNAFTVRYFRMPLLLESIMLAKADGSIPRLRLQLSKISVLILDDWLMTPLDASSAREILELVDDRSAGKSLILSTQYPVSMWHERIGEPSVADAILDRIVHTAHRLEIEGESMRKRKSVV